MSAMGQNRTSPNFWFFSLDAVAEPTQGSSADPDCSAAESIQFRLAFTAGLTHVREAETAAVAL
jgi:hypothetical protein